MRDHARAGEQGSPLEPEADQLGAEHGPRNQGQSGLRAMVHDLFWFLVVPVAFVGAPLIAWALAAIMPVENFEAAGLGPAYVAVASDIHAGLLLFGLSGWLFLLGVWFYRTPDPHRNFIFYAERGMVFAFVLYAWALSPSLLSLLLAVFTKFLTQTS